MCQLAIEGRGRDIRQVTGNNMQIFLMVTIYCMVCVNEVNGIFSLMAPNPRFSQFIKVSEIQF